MISIHTRKLKFIFFSLVALSPSFILAQEQSPENLADDYTKVITERANKIVEPMTFDTEARKTRVRDIIVQQYRNLSSTQDKRDSLVAVLSEQYADNKTLRDLYIDKLKAETEMKIANFHYEFLAKLAVELTPDQIEQVKNGLTYNVLPNTYQAFQDMIPTLTEAQKKQILIWLTEAREHAIDGGTSKEKHAWFGKYKGRINNYLAAQGYDLKKEGDEWQKRIKEKEKSH